MIDARMIHDGCGGEVGGTGVGDPKGICNRCLQEGEIVAITTGAGDHKIVDGRMAVLLQSAAGEGKAA